MTSSSCMGSKKSRSDVSKSVETVSGLLLTIWTSTPLVPQCLDCVDRAVIELDSLADPDRAGPEDEHLSGVAWHDLAAGS